ncbi:MAG: hypothetical protein AB1761_17790 [Pseudomonadota bacterium]
MGKKRRDTLPPPADDLDELPAWMHLDLLVDALESHLIADGDAEVTIEQLDRLRVAIQRRVGVGDPMSA